MHPTFQTEDGAKFEKDWRSELNIPSTYDSYKPTFTELISELESIWDAHFAL